MMDKTSPNDRPAPDPARRPETGPDWRGFDFAMDCLVPQPAEDEDRAAAFRRFPAE
ncbi:MAG: hypothetical protein ACU0DK_16880 [Pseudooceanicola sp.]